LSNTTKSNKLIGQVHVIVIKQQGNQVFICGLHQNPQKQRIFNRAFEFACRMYNQTAQYSSFGSQVKVIDKSNRGDIISVALGALMKNTSKLKRAAMVARDDDYEEDEVVEDDYEEAEEPEDDGEEDTMQDDE